MLISRENRSNFTGVLNNHHDMNTTGRNTMKTTATLLTAAALSAGLFLATSNANANLIDQGATVYDTGLGISWLKNANLAATDTFGVSGIGPSGTMSWTTANQWIGAMNTADYLGYSDWRLPTTAPVNGSAFNNSFSYNGATDWGYNISAPGASAFAGATGSELAYMYYNDLGNKAFYDVSGNPQAGYGVTNAGPFQNLQSSAGSGFWSGTESAPGSGFAWNFYTDSGYQIANTEGAAYYAWAVRPGDVAAVPEPETLDLLFIGLLGLGLGRLARRRG